MRLDQIIKRRRMVHQFEPRAIPSEVLDRILESALHAPSAGFSQGLGLIVIDEPQQLKWVWETTAGEVPASAPPVLVIPIPDKRVYIERYSMADKGGPDGPYSSEAGWPVAYWDIDAGMACMLMMMKAVDEGVGGWFFGFAAGEKELLEGLGVPDGLRPIGALALGYQAERDRKAGSSVTIRRRTMDELIHRGRW